jgi:HK97 family phage prohead protease
MSGFFGFTFDPATMAKKEADVLDHKQFATAETETDEANAPGAFVALVSTYAVDRQNDQVQPGAFRRTLEEWRKSGRMIPVHADHDGKVGAVVGYVDPRLTMETEQGLEAGGVLVTSTALGERVYELVKQGTLAWSIGYRVPEGGRRRNGKITELIEIDLAEISAVSTPANAGARTLSIKSHRPVQIASFPC